MAEILITTVEQFYSVDKVRSVKPYCLKPQSVQVERAKEDS
jgi:hypothetical protein